MPGCSLCAGPGNLPTDTDLVVAVAADPVWLEGRGLNMTELRGIVTSALREDSCQRVFVEVSEAIDNIIKIYYAILCMLNELMFNLQDKHPNF